MAPVPRVSVVMTAYNNAPYLVEAIDSIYAQDEQDLELIFVDDGSTDDTRAIVARYGDRLRYVHQANAGLGAARNTGLALARAGLVAFCDADDIHLPHRLSAHAALLERFPEAAQVFSDLSPFKDGQVLKESLLKERVLGPTPKGFDELVQEAFGASETAASLSLPVPARYAERPVYHGRVAPLIALVHLAWGGASMFRRAALVAIGGHDPTLRRYTDWYICSKLSKSYELVFLDLPVLQYRLHPAQLTKMPMLGAQCYRQVIEQVWKSDPVFYAQHRDIVDRSLGAAFWQMGKAAEELGDWRKAAECFGSSARAYPRQKQVYLDWLKAVARAPRSRRAER